MAKAVRPRGLRVYKIELDDEEIGVLVDFHHYTADGADESGEAEEAKERRARAAYLNLKTLV